MSSTGGETKDAETKDAEPCVVDVDDEFPTSQEEWCSTWCPLGECCSKKMVRFPWVTSVVACKTNVRQHLKFSVYHAIQDEELLEAWTNRCCIIKYREWLKLPEDDSGYRTPPGDPPMLPPPGPGRAEAKKRPEKKADEAGAPHGKKRQRELQQQPHPQQQQQQQQQQQHQQSSGSGVEANQLAAALQAVTALVASSSSAGASMTSTVARAPTSDVAFQDGLKAMELARRSLEKAEQVASSAAAAFKVVNAEVADRSIDRSINRSAIDRSIYQPSIYQPSIDHSNRSAACLYRLGRRRSCCAVPMRSTFSGAVDAALAADSGLTL